VYTVGIVGLGHVARHHVAALERSRQFRLVAGCDRDPSRFGLLGDNVATFTHIEEMLAMTGLDAVIVASPNRVHVDHGLRVLEAGKWLVMEKPLAETREDFDRFNARRKALNGKCTVALHAAFGVELEWFCQQRGMPGDAAHQLVEFRSNFYDPYFKNQHLVDSARSLGGAWVDSGINALSVVSRFVDPNALEISDSRMTRVAGPECREVQGSVDFTFKNLGLDCEGSIDTNWTLGRNKKTTLIRVSGEDSRYLLDHSAQQVIRKGDGGDRLLFSCDNGLPRLTNHYIGVFDDLGRQFDTGLDNFSICAPLHDLLYRAEEWETRTRVR
jgi:D-galactose 1-dehydrogenase